MTLTLTATHSDITTLHVDAIINAATLRMRGGGGVDGVIHRAASHRILKYCIGSSQPASPRATPAGPPQANCLPQG